MHRTEHPPFSRSDLWRARVATTRSITHLESQVPRVLEGSERHDVFRSRDHSRGGPKLLKTFAGIARELFFLKMCYSISHAYTGRAIASLSLLLQSCSGSLYDTGDASWRVEGSLVRPLNIELHRSMSWTGKWLTRRLLPGARSVRSLAYRLCKLCKCRVILPQSDGVVALPKSRC